VKTEVEEIIRLVTCIECERDGDKSPIDSRAALREYADPERLRQIAYLVVHAAGVIRMLNAGPDCPAKQYGAAWLDVYNLPRNSGPYG